MEQQSNFQDYVIEELNIGIKAKIIRRMIEKYIHNESDFNRLNELMKQYGRNNIAHCLNRLKKASLS